MDLRRAVMTASGLLSIICGPLLLIWPTVVSSQSNATADARFQRIATVITEKMKEYGVPGVAVGIQYADVEVTHGFGVTSIDNPLSVTDDTLFQLGSISKTFTGTLVMRLVEGGKLRLDAPVREYIPTFRTKDETASSNATVLTLLTHMGGWEGDFFDDAGNGDDALARVVGRMVDLEQVAPFNTVWSYNNAGFYVIGRLIELATGQPYETALKELLLEPLGLQRTFIFPADVMTYRFAVGHGGPVDRLNVLRLWPIPRAAHAAGGVTSSVKDLLRYGRFHLGDGMLLSGSRLLSPDSLRRMQATQLVKHGTDEEMAITWHISTAGGIRRVSHGGSTLGQQSLLTLVPSKQFAIALLTNSGRGGRLIRDVEVAAMKEYLGVTIADPSPTPVVETELAAYVGRYFRPFSDVVVTQERDRLMIQTIPKMGFPTPTSPVPPPGPAAPYVFYAKDRLIALDGPTKGARAEIIRQSDGSIGWIRVGGRVARRVGGRSSLGR